VKGPFSKFFADRGTHLAAMIAYFALLSLVPLIFCALALLGLAERPEESDYLVDELRKIFPGLQVADILNAVEAIQDNALTLAIVGGTFLAWTSLSLFSVLESALNIVYGRPNRPFLHGKLLAFTLTGGAVLTLVAGLLAGSIGFDLLKRFAGGVVGNTYVAYTLSVVVSLAAVFIFLVCAYYLLPNVRMTLREALPGAVLGSVALEATFQLVPTYIRLSQDVVVLQALGGPVILLVWLYVMANVIVFGAEVNWWLGRRPEGEPEDAPGLA
jgi:membrane protein